MHLRPERPLFGLQGVHSKSEMSHLRSERAYSRLEIVRSSEGSIFSCVAGIVIGVCLREFLDRITSQLYVGRGICEMMGRRGLRSLWVFTFPYIYPGWNSPTIRLNVLALVALLAAWMRLLALRFNSSVGLREIGVNFESSARIRVGRGWQKLVFTTVFSRFKPAGRNP